MLKFEKFYNRNLQKKKKQTNKQTNKKTELIK